ncbi:unnamed protein product [Angiostrongylus costaricensis]|uniref:Uncharacterized protein n=1 Tax=Angiostrongylus costaricensis TaxID=334426 RepID=A0A0R3Q2T1_ANGCS|nr:unnamed protein product [Angiostrongylus costaricensis]
MTTRIQHALGELATMFEKSHPTSPNTEEEFAQYSTTAEEAIGNTFEYLVLLHARIHGFKAHAELLNTSYKHSTTNSSKDESTVTAVVKNLELPTIPIPTFNGDNWDWDNFWELFNLNVHSQNLSELQKFNYLLNFLKGEPLQSMKKFQLTRQNYLKAIEFLTNKYGNSEELIRHLLRKMDKISLHSSSIHQQRRLLEDIEAIIGQLVQKGENVDNQSMYQKVLSKFPVGIQRKVIHKKITSPDEPRQNYLKAIEFLTNKYGNPEELIRQLLRKMDKISLHSSSIHEQRRLLEDIEAIIGQLVQKGENVDNQSMYQKVLSKFPFGIQRKVIHKKITSPDEPFTMKQFLKYFKVVITSEEQVCR